MSITLFGMTILSKQLGYRLAREILTKQNKSANINSKGVEQNGSTNTELLAGGEISTVSGGNDSLRQSGENSKKLISLLGIPEDWQGKNTQTIRAGESGWLVSTEQRFEKAGRDRSEESILRDLSKLTISEPIRLVDALAKE